MRVATSWVAAEKLMMVFYAVRQNYPMPGVSFVPRGMAFWSPEIEETLKRLVAQGLVEESNGSYRLSKKGNKLAEKVLSNNSFALPYADVVFYMMWDVGKLVEHIRANYRIYAIESSPL